jgi:hypothetical protein
MKELRVYIGDELWQGFKNVYAQKNHIEIEKELDAELPARELMAKALKAYALNTDLNESPATHRTAMDNINEANEIAKSVPAMRLYKSVGVYGPSTDWSIWLEGNDYKAKARGAEALLREVKEAKAFWDALQDLEAKEREDASSAKEVIDEAFGIAKAMPVMVLIKERDVTDADDIAHTIEIPAIGYTVKTRGADQLLEAVKDAKAYHESLGEAEAGKRFDVDESEIIRIESLELGTKELLLYFIEHLTIKEISEVLEDDDYPHLIWDEMYYIREKLKRSIEN